MLASSSSLPVTHIMTYGELVTCVTLHYDSVSCIACVTPCSLLMFDITTMFKIKYEIYFMDVSMEHRPDAQSSGDKIAKVRSAHNCMRKNIRNLAFLGL